MSALDIAVALAVLAALAGAAWTARGLWRALDSHDTRQAAWLAACEGRPEPGHPGTDVGLYLNCIAIYGDCNELDRLRDAIERHRKGDHS